MTEKTGLEHQEDEVKAMIFGNPTGINAFDKSMLEISETNRLIFDARQSELQLALNLLYRALVNTDNRHPSWRKVKDSQTGEWRTERENIDNWKWLTEFDRIIRTNQLTIKGYSRAQHLRQSASQAAIAVEEEQAGFWQRLFGGR
jgi:hypothetical protein